MKAFTGVVLLSWLIFPLLSSAQTGDVNLRRIDSLFVDWTIPNAPGGVVAIIRNGEVIYKKGFGLADIEKKILNAPALKYDLASMAKQFTGMCIALLEEQGKISREDNIQKFYPEFKFGDEVRIKNLLDHTSGIREAYVLAILSGKVNLKGEVPKKYDTKDQLLKVLSRERDLNFKPGDEVAYTNINYILLGDIVEKVSGRSLPQFADSAIFKPLGMAHTVFRDKPGMKIKNEAVGYLYKKKKFKRRDAWGGILGDHNLLSTIDDMILWDQNFFHNQLGKKDKLLIEKMTTGSKLNNGEETHYAYGLWTTDYKGLHAINHGGDDGRHTSLLLRFPEQNLSVICLANSSRYGDTQKKTFGAADILLNGLLKKPIVTSPPTEFIKVREDELRPKSGLYTWVAKNGLGKLRKVSLSEGSLFINSSYYGQGLKLSPVDADHFAGKTADGSYLDISFSLDSGQWNLHEKFMDREVRHFSKIKEVRPDYKAYRGSYRNESTGATLKVRKKKEKIVAHKGIIKIPLVPYGEDMFYAPENDALFIFERDESKQIARIRVNASDFRNFVFTKQ